MRNAEPFKRLCAGGFARLAPESPSLDHEADSLAVKRRVADFLAEPPKADQLPDFTALLAVVNGRGAFDLKEVRILALFGLNHLHTSQGKRGGFIALNNTEIRHAAIL